MGGSDITMEEISELKRQLAILEAGGKRKSATGRFSVRKKLRVAPTKRMRSTGVTPRTAKKADTRTSRSRQITSRKLFGSVSRSRSASRPAQGRMDPVLRAILSGNNKPYERELKRIKANSRKVRHKNARTVLKKMPAGGKPYAKRRKSMRKPKGAYRGATMPRWAKGETKHILANDNCDEDIAKDQTGLGTTLSPTTGVVDRDNSTTGENSMNIGHLKAFCLNPIEQGTHQRARNGRSVDGTYLRVQGHIRNSNLTEKAYVRMLVLAIKGGVSDSSNVSRMSAPFVQTQLYKRIDGTVTGFEVPTSTYVTGSSGPITPTGQGAALVRTLQLPVNKSLYTVLYDQKMQLASTGESFGSSDRLFDAKIALKQRTQYGSALADSFEKNQLVFVVMTVDPTCSDLAPSGGDIKLEFESKYSYKDF